MRAGCTDYDHAEQDDRVTSGLRHQDEDRANQFYDSNNEVKAIGKTICGESIEYAGTRCQLAKAGGNKSQGEEYSDQPVNRFPDHQSHTFSNLAGILGHNLAQSLKLFGKMSEKMIQASQPSDDRVIRFDSWSLDAEVGVLSDGNGVELRLEPRLAKLMSVLMSQTGSYVSRRDLIDAVWPDAVVTEQSLTRAVSDLRKFLGENLAQPPIIETASKQGYRLIYQTQNQATRKLNYWAVMKKVAYGVGVLVLLVLVLRGLNY